MFVIGPNHKELENKGVSCICLHRWAILEMVAPVYKTSVHFDIQPFMFQCWFAPVISLTEQQYPVCYWSNIMIKGAVCRTKNNPAIQLCYPAVHCSRQVVSSFPPGRLGQVHPYARQTSSFELLFHFFIAEE